ncbi:MAG: porin family protein [Bacteroidota bacterium]|nr:porin family protein [Bacteroidota bacterium]
MQKSTIILVFLLLTGYAAAQSTGDTRFTFVLSPQISWIKSDMDRVNNGGSKMGYNFGLLVDYFFGDNYAITSGLTINTTGGKLEYLSSGNNTVEARQRYNLRYIEIPMGLKLRSEDLKRMNIYGRFGLSPQLNIMAKDNDDNGISDEVKLLDLGYHIGGGIEYSVGGKNALVFGLLFNNGFMDITSSSYHDKAILNRLVFEFGFIF